MKSLKKIAFSLATVATIGMTAVPAFAASENATASEGHTGKVLVDNESTNPLLRKGTTVDRDGGVWNYGVGKKYVWSYYTHPTRLHRTSVQPGVFASVVRSGWEKGGKKAKVSAVKASKGNFAYYDIG